MVSQVVTEDDIVYCTWYTRMLVCLGQGRGNGKAALGTLLGRVTVWENIHIRSRELGKCYTGSKRTFVVDWRTSGVVKRYEGKVTLPWEVGHYTHETHLP